MVLRSTQSNYEISYRLQFTFTDGLSYIRWEFSWETLIYHSQNRWETQEVRNKKSHFRAKNGKSTTQLQWSCIWIPELNCLVGFAFGNVVAVVVITVCLPSVLTPLGKSSLQCTHSAVLFDWVYIHLVNTWNWILHPVGRRPLVG